MMWCMFPCKWDQLILAPFLALHCGGAANLQSASKRKETPVHPAHAPAVPPLGSIQPEVTENKAPFHIIIAFFSMGSSIFKPG